MAWLVDKRILYWDDIDVHGFQILSQVRTYLPRTCSLMMVEKTFEAFWNYSESGAETGVTLPSNLTPEEHVFYHRQLNRGDQNRLEQEKISRQYAIRKIQLAISPDDGKTSS